VENVLVSRTVLPAPTAPDVNIAMKMEVCVVFVVMEKTLTMNRKAKTKHDHCIKYITRLVNETQRLNS
jgi:hypothetical protein